MKFKELNISENLIRALDELNFKNLTEVQEKSIPVIMNGDDLICQSKTGTGKTACFCIPVIEKIDKNLNKVQTIIVVPTRELAIQITEEIRKFVKYEPGVKTLAIYGGEPIEHQIKAIKKDVKIIVGTPGRILDHIRRRTIKLVNVKTLILDEADEMFDMGFKDDVTKIIKECNVERQTMLFSATMSDEITTLAKRFMNDPEKIVVKDDKLTANEITQFYLELKEKEKNETVVKLIDLYNSNKTVIFTNTKKKADELFENLKRKEYNVELIHGDIDQGQRTRIMKRFKNSEFPILIATDIAARGLDINSLELVINYDVPQELEYYVHRIGRTGRNGNFGKAYTLVTLKEISKLKEIEKFAKIKIEKGKIPTELEVIQAKSQKLIEEVQKVIDEKSFESNPINNEILSELLFKNDINEIAGALLEIINDSRKTPISNVEKDKKVCNNRKNYGKYKRKKGHN